MSHPPACTFGLTFDGNNVLKSVSSEIKYGAGQPKIQVGDELTRIEINTSTNISRTWPIKTLDNIKFAKEEICKKYPNNTEMVFHLTPDPNRGGYPPPTNYTTKIMLQNDSVSSASAATLPPGAGAAAPAKAVCRIGIQVSKNTGGLIIDDIRHGGAVDKYNTEHGTTFNEGDIISHIDNDGPDVLSGFAPGLSPRRLFEGECNSTLDIRLLDKYD